MGPTQCVSKDSRSLPQLDTNGQLGKLPDYQAVRYYALKITRPNLPLLALQSDAKSLVNTADDVRQCKQLEPLKCTQLDVLNLEDLVLLDPTRRDYV